MCFIHHPFATSVPCTEIRRNTWHKWHDFCTLNRVRNAGSAFHSTRVMIPKLNVEGSNPFARFGGDGWRGCGGGSVECDVDGAKSVPYSDADGEPCSGVNRIGGRPRAGLIPTPPWQYVLRHACEVCFGGLWVRFIPLADGVPSWRPSHASCKKRARTAPGRYLRSRRPWGKEIGRNRMGSGIVVGIR